MVTVLPHNGVLPIPPELWKALGWGEHVAVELQADSHGTLVAKPAKSFSIAETAGLLPRPAHPVTLQQMQDAIASCSEQ
jgi:antitoxin component of MazEF toxin-antitoxin module